MIKIYALVDPITDQIRYIGKTYKKLNTRLSEHVKEINSKRCSNLHKKHWILKLISNGEYPKIELIDKVSELDWQFWEQHYINLYKSWGFSLINLTDGGEGQHGVKISEETRKKRSLARKGKPSNRKGCKYTEKQKIDASLRAKEAYKSGKRKPVKHTEKSKNAIKIAMITNFQNGTISTKGEKNGMFGKTKRVLINDILYNSEHEAAKALNVHYKTIHYRIKSNNFPNYTNFLPIGISYTKFI